jgi:tetraacyldisaccharide 4'-kinase
VKPAYRLFQALSRARLAMYRRGWLKARRLRRPVLSVGNLSFGGSGKTPFVLRLGAELIERGYKVSILSRGYRRTGKGLVPVSDGKHILVGVEEAGDEAFLLAKALPKACVTVCEQRHQAGEFAEAEHGVDVHLLDDGFQHVQLRRSLDIVLMRGDEDLKQGRWREPLAALRRAHLVVLTGEAWPVEARLKRLFPDLLIHKTDLVNYGYFNAGGNAVAVDWMKEHPWIALAGIARPERFFDDLRRVPLTLAETLPLPDHYRPKPGDAERLNGRLKSLSARGVLMTQKDFHKWQDKGLEVFYHRVGFPPLPGWILEMVLKACEKPRRP